MAYRIHYNIIENACKPFGLRFGLSFGLPFGLRENRVFLCRQIIFFTFGLRFGLRRTKPDRANNQADPITFFGLFLPIATTIFIFTFPLSPDKNGSKSPLNTASEMKRHKKVLVVTGENAPMPWMLQCPTNKIGINLIY